MDNGVIAYVEEIIDIVFSGELPGFYAADRVAYRRSRYCVIQKDDTPVRIFDSRYPLVISLPADSEIHIMADGIIYAACDNVPGAYTRLSRMACEDFFRHCHTPNTYILHTRVCS